MNKCKEVYLLFVLGKAQELIVNSIIKELSGKEVIIFSSLKDFKCNYDWVNISPIRLIDYLSLLITLKKVLKKIEFSESNVYIVAPHLINYVVHKIIKKHKYRLKYICIYDGVLNYRVNNGSENKLKKYQYFQFIKSLTIFSIYNLTNDDIKLISDFDPVEFWIPKGVNAKYFKTKVPIREFDLEFELSDSISNSILLIESPNFNVEDVEKMKVFVNDLIYSRKVSSVFIKLHPSQKKSFMIDHIFLDSVKVIHDKDPVELIFLKNRFSYVVASNSSAIINIKSLFCEVEAYSVIKHKEKSIDNNIKLLMKKIGVVVV